MKLNLGSEKMVEKICPKCGEVTVGGDFCSECGTKLNSNQKGVCNRIDERISLSSLIFSFIIMGLFLFVGSVFWGIFTSNGTINFSANIFLTVLFAIFFGGMFVGYVNCLDDSYIAPNFFVYFGTIVAAILCGVGLIFTFVSAFASSLSPLFSSSNGGTSSYSSVGGGTDTNIISSLVSNFVVEILILVLLMPAAAYSGIYVGFLIRNNL